jgi:molybdopterin molybdotransferase
MISVEQALDIVQNNIVPTLNFERIEVSKAIGCILKKDIISPIDMPPFRQSAMDGYALCLNGESTYHIIGEVKAGDDHHPTLKKGEAVRIFTGAPVPDSANAVIMQEKVTVEQHELTIESAISINDNIRPLGEQVSKNQIALKKGTMITSAAIGFITSLGITEIVIYSRPSIAIVVTGNELVEAGKVLAFGQIYGSNAIMLTSALNKLGFQNISSFKVDDDYKNTIDVLGNVIANHDMVLVSGGISVGEYDFVGKALLELGVEQVFYKVKQKPGKPFFFGKKDKKIIFALPGNPAAALSCFYIYVNPALQKMAGDMNYSSAKTKARSESNYTKKGDRSHFLKAVYRNGRAEILDGQSSSMLHTFALANALVYVPETVDSIKINDEVEVILLPIN